MSRRPKSKAKGIGWDTFTKQLGQGRIDPIYLFVGAEEYYQDLAPKLLIETIDEGSRLLNVSMFYLDEGSPSGRSGATAVLDTANQFPMLAGRRVVIVRRFDKIGDHDTALLMSYLKTPSPTTTLVLQAASVDQRKKLTTLLFETATVVNCDPLGETAIARWAESYARKAGSRIDRVALQELVGMVGPQMMRLVRELDKLIAYSGGAEITREMVQELVPRAREHQGYELSEAVLERDSKRALRLACRLLDDGTEPLMLVGSLAALYRRMLIAKELTERGAGLDEIVRATGQYPERARNLANRVRRIPRPGIMQGLRRIAQVDDAIKNSEATPRMQIEYLVTELTLPESTPYGIFD